MVALDAVPGILAQGWVRKEHIPRFTLHFEGEGQGHSLLGVMGTLSPIVTSGSLIARWGDDFLKLELSGGGIGPLVVTDQGHGDLRESFANDALQRARAAFQGNVDAALELEGSWSAEIVLDPARALTTADPEFHWLVLSDPRAVSKLMMSTPWWRLRSLVQPVRPQIIAIHRANEGFDIRTVGQRLMSLTALTGLDSNLEDRSWISSEPSAAGLSAHSTASPKEMADPESVYPRFVNGDDDDTAEVLRVLRREATACCWAELATSVTVDEDVAHLEFFGLQRTSWVLGSAGPDLTAEEHAATFRLWRACTSVDNPDRLLAVRQVVSLFREEPWAHAADVDHASGPLFLALRGEATAEALRAQRDARAVAFEVARRTADATTDLAKSAVQRALAVFAAVGGIIVGQTTKTLTVGQATDLRHLAAVFLFILAPWSYFLEGRPVTASIGALPTDIRAFSELLTTDDQRTILDSETVRRASHQAWWARTIVPVGYVVVALVVLFLH